MSSFEIPAEVFTHLKPRQILVEISACISKEGTNDIKYYAPQHCFHRNSRTIVF